MKNIKAIIFDFDGVICESIEIKDKAYFETYLPYGKEIAEKALKYHKENEGVSRVKVFPYIHKKYLNTELSQNQLDEMCKKYSQTVVKQVIAAPLVDGVENFLKNNCKNYLMFISSGTPENEMQKIVIEKQLNIYFREVYGSPDTKDIHINRIIKNYNLSPSECVFVGDATTDRDMAKKTNINFIARIKPNSLLLDENIKIMDFWNFEQIIRNLCKID